MHHFPIFADLRDRRVLVVGGGEVAERKTRLLLDTGAKVVLAAPELTEWLRAQVEADRVTWIVDRFEPMQLDGVLLAVAATDDASVNAQVAAAGRERNVFVNVVDDAGLSSFIVPSIVDRSPLVVAVSTGGAAPVLARLVRARIEALLDESLGPLAALLGRWRARIKAALPHVAARRRFYEAAVRGEVARLLRAGRADAAEGRLAEMVARGGGPAKAGSRLTRVGGEAGCVGAAGGFDDPGAVSGSRAGSVILVGAGPGDPGLVTLHALRALQEADIILHDRLVSEGVLALARRDATRVAVGKSGHGPSVSQEHIHALMLTHARAGRRVVRLKGGDPFIFGRGGEELEFLRAHGIPYEVVPGITAAVACAAYAGIPLTHRGHAQSVRFVTARGSGPVDPQDWAQLAQDRQTLAFYMGVAALAAIGARLVEHGRDPSTPVAIVEDASRPRQRVTLARLGDLADVARHGNLTSPALVIVGEVAALAQDLHWFGAAPRQWAALRAAA